MTDHDNPHAFSIGRHRPIYLWAGPGTIRMNRLKFMDAPVDEDVHHEAHTPVATDRLVEQAAVNWAYLMYDWGFPPELEQEDWESFRKAVPTFHAAGMRLFGYVQTSNCVYDGSYRDKDWYAIDPKGRPYYYYTGRYMTCWQHPEWQEHLRQVIRGVVDAGADGVFFDNPWYGGQPLHWGGVWIGGAGCYCARCRALFEEETGHEIPQSFSPQLNARDREYLRWREAQMTQILGELFEYAHSLDPDVVISVNDFDAITRPSLPTYGIDLSALADIQDVMMIENFGLPKWKGNTLTNNALTLRTARALIGETPLSALPYDKGIGFDTVYPPRRFQQAMAEAAACDATMVIKGTEFVEQDGTFTLLTAEQYAPQRKAIGRYHRWLVEHAKLYRNRTSAARVGLLYPEDLWQDWDPLASLYFGVAQTLTAAGVPWCTIVDPRQAADLDTLFYFEHPPTVEGPNLVPVQELPHWDEKPPSFLARHDGLCSVVGPALNWLFRAYMRWRWARRLGDSLNLAQAFLQSPHFELPSALARRAVLRALDERPTPRVKSRHPVLAEMWKKDGERQLHLVNYAAKSQDVRITFEHPVRGRVLSPDHPERTFEGKRLNLSLDVYTVVVY